MSYREQSWTSTNHQQPCSSTTGLTRIQSCSSVWCSSTTRVQAGTIVRITWNTSTSTWIQTSQTIATLKNRKKYFHIILKRLNNFFLKIYFVDIFDIKDNFIWSWNWRKISNNNKPAIDFTMQKGALTFFYPWKVIGVTECMIIIHRLCDCN